DPGGRDDARPGHAVPVGAGAGRRPVLRRVARLERRRPHRLRRGQRLPGHDRERVPDQPEGAAQRDALPLSPALIWAVIPSAPASGSMTTAGSWYRQENSNASEPP